MKKKGKNLFAKISFSLLFSVVIVFSGIQVSAEDWNDAQKEVLKSVVAGWELAVKGDVEAIAALAAEGFMEWWPNDPSPFGNNYMKGKYIWKRERAGKCEKEKGRERPCPEKTLD